MNDTPPNPGTVGEATQSATQDAPVAPADNRIEAPPIAEPSPASAPAPTPPPENAAAVSAPAAAPTVNADAAPEPAPMEHGIGVLIVNLGTPDAPDAAAVRRYLKEFLSDPRVIE